MALILHYSAAELRRTRGGVMDTLTIVLVVVVLAAVAAAILFYLQNKRTQRLRFRFGPEYNRAVRSQGDTRHAERVLAERQKRVEKLDIKPLSANQRDEFARRWEEAQAHFADEP